MLNREKLHFQRSSQFHSGNDTLRGLASASVEMRAQRWFGATSKIS
jgi:hypothetical protein